MISKKIVTLGLIAMAVLTATAAAVLSFTSEAQAVQSCSGDINVCINNVCVQANVIAKQNNQRCE